MQSTWPITPELVALVKDAGLKLIVWTVDDIVTARRLEADGIDGLTTNQPGRMRQLLKAR